MSGGATDLSRATITEVVRDVNIISPASKARKPARTQQVFSTPDVLHAGRESRAEMVAVDKTVVRVGADTYFTFEPEQRQIALKRGSLLFQSDTGKGGGTIQTEAGVAAVEGTTLIVVTTSKGGLKVLLLEGKGKVTTPGGELRVIRAGEMTYMLPGGKLGPVQDFHLQQQVAASRLVLGFRSKLPSLDKIKGEIKKQNAKIARGALLETGLLAGNAPYEAYAITSREVLLKEEGSARSGRFHTAATSDSPIDQGTLDPARVFDTGGNEVPRFRLPALTGGAISHAQARDGTVFVARNTRLATRRIALGDFSDRSFFLFLSSEDFRIDQSASIGRSATKPLVIAAGRTIQNAPGTVLTARTAALTLIAFGTPLDLENISNVQPSADGTPLALDRFGIENRAGDIQLIGPTTMLTNFGVAAAGNFGIEAAGSLRIADSITSNPNFRLERFQLGQRGGPVETLFKGSPATAPNGRGIEAGKAVRITSRREIVVERVDFSAENIRIAAGGSLRVTSARFSNANFNSSRGRVELIAGPLIAINGAQFDVLDVSLAARTIDLSNTNFAAGSRVVLDSATGLLAPRANTGQPSRPGFVNFLTNVLYGGNRVNDGSPLIGTRIIIK